MIKLVAGAGMHPFNLPAQLFRSQLPGAVHRTHGSKCSHGRTMAVAVGTVPLEPPKSW